MSLPPVEIPLGAMRFNSDSQKLEYFNGDVWMQVHTFNPDLNGGGRGLVGGGSDPRVNNIDYITISTAGNATDIGDLTDPRDQFGAVGSNTRGVWGGGYTYPAGDGYSDVLDYVTIASKGNAIDFGNLSGNGQRKDLDACGNQTRGVWLGGRLTPVNKDWLDYITIASTGNSVDFGNLVAIRSNTTGYSSPTRGIIHGGHGTANIEYITIATTGNAQTFGDAAADRMTSSSGCSSATRGMAQGGATSDTIIDYVTIATLGNAIKFGDLYNGTGDAAGLSSCVRGILAGGREPSPETNIIQYITIATEGDSVDFGDLTYGSNSRAPAGLSNAHGGLG